MSKIRINELARELEVKPGVILELLPEMGVQEKKTHSSSVDEDVAIALRLRLAGMPQTGSGEPASLADTSNGHRDGETAAPREQTSVGTLESPQETAPHG